LSIKIGKLKFGKPIEVGSLGKIEEIKMGSIFGDEKIHIHRRKKK